MIDDIKKLNGIVSSLEEQAKQIDEYSGLLSAVNEARKQIESSQKLLKESTNEHMKFVIENRNTLERLDKRVGSLSKILEDYGRKQAQIADSIFSFDILSPQAFSEGLSASEEATIDYLTKLEQRIEAIVTAQKKVQRNFNILLFLSTAAVLGAVVFFGLK